MSLEQALEKNTAALIALTAAYLGQATTPVAETKVSPSIDAAAETFKKDKPAVENKSAAKTDKVETPPAEPEAGEEFTYATVALPIGAYIKENPDGGLDRIKALVAPFGIKTLKEAQKDIPKLKLVLAAFNKMVGEEA